MVKKVKRTIVADSKGVHSKKLGKQKKSIYLFPGIKRYKRKKNKKKIITTKVENLVRKPKTTKKYKIFLNYKKGVKNGFKQSH